MVALDIRTSGVSPSSGVEMEYTVSSLFGLCSRKVERGMRVWQCHQTASLTSMSGGEHAE